MTDAAPLADRWIDLAGVVNMRDAGGLPTADGHVIQKHRLIRSDNLQALPPASVRWLLDDAGVTDIVDLRTGVEVRGEGPGPMTEAPVTIHHLTLYPEDAQDTGIPDEDDDAQASTEDELPWVVEQADRVDEAERHEYYLLQHYLQYLTRRPDNVTEALRVIAHASGATIVHCAAGKDRTGTITALALHLVGVPSEVCAADYDATNERLPQILDRLRARPTYAADMANQDVSTQSTPAVVMAQVLDHIDREWDGVEAYLRRHGWTDADTEALRAKLLDPA